MGPSNIDGEDKSQATGKEATAMANETTDSKRTVLNLRRKRRTVLNVRPPSHAKDGEAWTEARRK